MFFKVCHYILSPLEFLPYFFQRKTVIVCEHNHKTHRPHPEEERIYVFYALSHEPRMVVVPKFNEQVYYCYKWAKTSHHEQNILKQI